MDAALSADPNQNGASPPSVDEAQPWALAELRTLKTLAWPVVLGNLGTVGMGMVDVAVVGRSGELALAGVSAGNIWTFGIFLLAMGILRGLDPAVSQAHGAGDQHRIDRAFGEAIVLAALLAVPCILGYLASGWGLTLLGQAPEVVPVAEGYTRIRAIGVPASLLFVGMSAWLQGQGRMRPPMIAIGVANLVNLCLDLVLVNGATLPGGLQVPAMGALGCAWATTAVNWTTALVLFLACRDGREAMGGQWSRAHCGVPSVLKDGLPIALQIGLEVWAFNAVGLMVGTFGATPLAAHAVAMQIVTFTFMVPFGLGVAASTRVGNLIGAGKKAGRAAVIAVTMGVSWMLCSVVVIGLFPKQVTGIFTDEPTVLAIAVSLLPIAAFFQIFDGVQAVSSGVLRGAGDTRVPSLINLFGYWAFGLPLGAWLGWRAGLGPPGVWWGLVAGLVVVSILLLGRLYWVLGRGNFSPRRR